MGKGYLGNRVVFVIRNITIDRVVPAKLPLTRTPKGKEKLFELTGVSVRFLTSFIPTKVH